MTTQRYTEISQGGKKELPNMDEPDIYCQVDKINYTCIYRIRWHFFKTQKQN